MSSDLTLLPSQRIWAKARACASCTVCEGAGYQTPPVLYTGYPDAPILALGQNPGEIKESDVSRQRWMEIFKSPLAPDVGAFMPIWYAWDFTTSPGYSRMSFVFGNNWILDGVMAWSNVVRCRTPGNASPSEQMVDNCKLWTSTLLEGRRAIVMVGALARHALLGDDAMKLEWGVPRRHPSLGIIMAIKHYSVWSTHEEAAYLKAYTRMREALAL